MSLRVRVQEQHCTRTVATCYGPVFESGDIRYTPFGTGSHARDPRCRGAGGRRPPVFFPGFCSPVPPRSRIYLFPCLSAVPAIQACNHIYRTDAENRKTDPSCSCGKPALASAPSLNKSNPCTRRPPRNNIFPPPSNEQPRAAGASQERASSLHPSSSPAQRELPQIEHHLSLHRAAPRSGSFPKLSIISPSIEQPRAPGASLERASSLHPSSSPAQRELPHKEHHPSIHRAAPRSGSFPRRSIILPSIGQPRAAGASSERASSLHPSSSPAQRELPHKEHHPSIHRAAPRSGSFSRRSIILPSIGQPRAAGASPD